MKLVGRVAKAVLETEPFVRLAYPPFDVLVAKVGEGYYAIEDNCNHAGASLAQGKRVRGDCVACPMHGYVFRLTTGELVIPRGLCSAQRTFEVRDEGTEVAVWDGPPVVVSS